ncbi:MAG: hypothetical protein A3E87_10970 [Gammaproteobacteria bacterium RIFCSPHIGHO2_12_FULL_35_23]|nr:MAG: hypothetical protein A3E87_10970 [Gammaproteobacteria bacterium RIFCSPHIGHO2_12_FULL_35_23]
MKTINQVKKYVEELPTGQPFSAANVQHFGSPENIRKILSRLVETGELKRVSRGVFVKPKKSAYLGEVLPSPYEVVQAIAKNTGETVTIHGAEAARRLHLTTQVPMQAMFNTSGLSRKIRIGNRMIKLQHVGSRKLVAPGTTRGNVISALWYLEKEKVSQKTIQTIKQQLNEEEFSSVLQEIHKMPAWMAKQFYLHQHKKVRRHR